MSRTLPAVVLSFLAGVGGTALAPHLLVAGSGIGQYGAGQEGARQQEASDARRQPPGDGNAGGESRTKKEHEMQKDNAALRLGNFSVSLAVKDLGASRAFYENLGFKVFGGDAAQNWLIMQNDTATIGLFQGMFQKNTLTFNPGWDRSAGAIGDFDDVRQIQRALEAEGVALAQKADEGTTGPAYIMLMDPDGNPILIDQHVDAPKP